MENGVNSKEILCIKFSENPRKGFLQSLDQGMNKIKKRIYFRTLHHSSFLLLFSHNFNTTRSGDNSLVGHPNEHAKREIVVKI